MTREEMQARLTKLREMLATRERLPVAYRESIPLIRAEIADLEAKLAAG